jgi:hypothetical protein
MGIAQVLLCIAASCVAAEAAPDETTTNAAALNDAVRDDAAATKVDFYLTSMLAERQKLRSGEFVVSGTKSAKDSKKPELDNSGRVLIFCAFDEARIRFDNREPGLVAELPLTTPPKMKPSRIDRMFFLTPKQSVTWIQGNGNEHIAITAPNSIFGLFLFFDVRGFGLATWNSLTDKRGPKVETTIAALKRDRRKKTVDTSDSKYVQLVFLMEWGPRFEELRYWLRPDQGFAPVRLEARTRKKFPPDEGWHVNEHAETSWEQTDGVWLPAEFELTRSDESGEVKMAWKIRWRSVNKPIDDARFDWKDFGAPETVPVIDTTTGKVVVTRPGRER